MTHSEFLKSLLKNSLELKKTIIRDLQKGFFDQEGFTPEQVWCAASNKHKVKLISVDKGMKKLLVGYENYALDITSPTLETIASGLDNLEAGFGCTPDEVKAAVRRSGGRRV